MRPDRRLPAEGLVEQHAQRHAAQPLVAAHDVADLHKVIVYHSRQVIGRPPIGFEQHGILQQAVVEADVAADRVVERCFALERLDRQADHGRIAGGLVLGALLAS